ncbi:hypothetical protein E2P81_ATG09724 [Venturia nashicola]|nr:hypothetical protein E2P81_ATG09724 [Venturia nashicola]
MAPIDSPACMGKFYTFKTRRECYHQGIRFWEPKGNAAGHMAVCLTEPDNHRVVTIVTVTSNDRAGNWEYIPIYRTSRSRPNYTGQYDFRLEFEDYPSACSYSPISHPHQSYLRLEPFEISLEMLKPVHPNEWIGLDTYYQEYPGKAWELHGEEWTRPNMKNGAEHLSLAPESLHRVEKRMLVLFGKKFRDMWNPLFWPRSGEVNVSAGGAKQRLRERMGWKAETLGSKLDGMREAWELRKRRKALLERIGIEEKDEDEEMDDSVEPAPSSTMLPEEVDDFLESMMF